MPSHPYLSDEETWPLWRALGLWFKKIGSINVSDCYYETVATSQVGVRHGIIHRKAQDTVWFAVQQ